MSSDDYIQQRLRAFLLSDRNNYIPKEEMLANRMYICKARNFTVGKWNGEKFEYMRTKWGSTFPATESHWDDGAPFGTVKPIEVLSYE